MLKTVVAAALLATAAFAAKAEPVDDTTEIASLLESLGDRCWAVDLDGAVLDAAALGQIEGPVDIELECVIEDEKQAAAKPLPAHII